MNKSIRKLAVIAMVVMGMATTAQAGSTAHTEPHFKAGQVVSFAKKVEKEVAAKGARVFIMSRVGRPPAELPPGFHYTHVAFGVYSMIKTADGRTIPGYAIHNLYQRDKEPEVSDLVVDYPVDFFSGVYQLKTSVIIPKPELQARLLRVIASGTYKKLHNPRYSVLANPYNAKYQNCTEFVLDVLNAAIYRTDNIHVIKTDERAYFDAQKVDINPLKLLFASITMPDVRTSDQNNTIETASFTTIAAYLKKYGLVQEEMTITP